MNYFNDLTWNGWIKDIIDIGIVSYIIYKLILLVRGTRAVQLLKGILVLVGTWAISTWFNLYTLKWLMNQMFTFGVLAVLIIFQPELRRALEQLGRGKLFARTSTLERDIVAEQIESVMKAVQHMAQRSIGALIVFERTTGVTELIESGIQMESRITSELIMNILHLIHRFMTGRLLSGVIKSWPLAVICRFRKIHLSAKSLGPVTVPLLGSVKLVTLLLSLYRKKQDRFPLLLMG